MRCSCRGCGTYMVQQEHGLESGCRCPACGLICRDCMGSRQGPMSAEELRNSLELRLRLAEARKEEGE